MSLRCPNCGHILSSEKIEYRLNGKPRMDLHGLTSAQIKAFLKSKKYYGCKSCSNTKSQNGSYYFLINEGWFIYTNPSGRYKWVFLKQNKVKVTLI